MNKLIILLAVIIAIGITFLIVSLNTDQKTQEQNLGGVGSFEMTAVTNSVISVSTSTFIVDTNQVFATNTNTGYRRMQNSGNDLISCVFDSSTSTLSSAPGIVLATTGAASIWVGVGDTFYGGQINCLASVSTGTLNIIESRLK